MGKTHLQFMLIYFALENLIPKVSSENTPQDTVCDAIIIPGTAVIINVTYDNW